MKGIIISLFIIVTATAIACKSKPIVVQPAFYFWKSNSSKISAEEKEYLDTLHTQKLYVKFFEVATDPVSGNIPVSKTTLSITNADAINAEIIPVVFIKNEVMQHTSSPGLDSLADNVVYLVNKMSGEKINKPFNEIQIDCDWTEHTKDNYFHFLKAVKQISGKTISVTLRLYPYKYPDKMGVPPTDRAMLMCYNLVNALKNESKNSILDLNELKLYLNSNSSYPLHLDVALPAYSWMLIYQNNQFKGVISQQNESLLPALTPLSDLWYEVNRDTVVDDYYLRNGDRIKYENITANVLQNAADIVKQNVKLGDSVTIAIFHLDQQKLSNYSYEIFNNIYTDFSK